MKFKNIMLISLLLAILTIGAVSASDDSNESIALDESSQTEDIMLEDVSNEVISTDDLANQEEILTNNPKTFLALNDTINGNDDKDVYLTGNYTFELGSDGAFKDGVIIDRDVTIHGNGFTLDGDNVARIFSVDNKNIVFKDIIFVNGKSVDGGAIYGECTAINCTFTSNTANSGGATFGQCTAINCTFTSNTAIEGDGGAMIYSTAINCTFTSNTASFTGGAVYYTTAINCTFTSNIAFRGGALSSGSAANSNFYNNSAYHEGGAIFYASATNCTFKNNKADNYGGAMSSEGFEATNCQFINNSAKDGGATYKITANKCEFSKNTATENGGAMYEGTAIDCIFKDNKAGIIGDDIYNTNVPKPVLSVSDYSSPYNSGDKLQFSFTTASGLPINDANITIRVYKNNALVGTYYALSGEGWVVSIGAGSYVATCSIENQAYDVEPANATLKITKANTKLTSQDVTTTYNGGKYLVVTLNDNKGKPVEGVEVTININTPNTLTTDSNGQVKFSTNGLTPVKTYTATITFAGNDNYTKASELTAKIIVKKATPKMTAKAKTFKKSVKTKKYTITLKTNQNKVMKNTKVTLKVNKKTYTAKTNKKGVATFKITKLTKKSKYSAVIKYAGSKYYNKLTKKVKITVK